ncbi:MAG: 3-phosphoshikimate 1-carboxyvinyltransferase [Acidobacteria bacterium]|nr:3-phosphoshikimate 1-carboxyvinyltransferase [Acidobacteriota bacterium]
MRVITGIKQPFVGEVFAPPDKSVTHRALLLAAEADGTSLIRSPSRSADCQATIECLRALGVGIQLRHGHLRIDGLGLGALRAPARSLYAANSGTTMRLLAGILARQPFDSILDGDASLRRRPMERVAEPLNALGACVSTTRGFPPVHIAGRSLRGGRVVLQTPSAQVKSAVLLAGLGAAGVTRCRVPVLSRDHTERLFFRLGLPLKSNNLELHVRPVDRIPAFEMRIPGDPSGAAFLAGAAAVIPGATVRIHRVGLNPTRTLFFRYLERMGAEIAWSPDAPDPWEPGGTLTVRGADLRAVRVDPADVPLLIDELPLLAALAAVAQGETSVRGAAELRVKESDRIAAMATGLRRLGAGVEEHPDGFSIEGGSPLHGADVDAAGDHRVAMAFAVAALAAVGITRIRGAESAAVSYPGFFDVLDRLTAGFSPHRGEIT